MTGDDFLTPAVVHAPKTSRWHEGDYIPSRLFSYVDMIDEMMDDGESELRPALFQFFSLRACAPAITFPPQ